MTADIITRKITARVRLRFEELERRELLCATCLISADDCAAYALPSLDVESVMASTVAERTLTTAELKALLNESELECNQTDIMNLSSLPDSSWTIYLDFNGHTTTNTTWNTSYNNGLAITTPPFSLDTNKSTNFSEMELLTIYDIWLRVSEDYLPFGVNVTTIEPEADNLIRSGTNDSAWGIRVCIGGSYSDWYGKGAGGLAYVGSFNDNIDRPCFIFSQNLNNAKYIAEALTHEVGHTVGLSHDGDLNGTTATNREYYAGTDDWAPIMGQSYYALLTQWSRGEYEGANNYEDDLSIITTTNGFTYRTDDHGDTLQTATSLEYVAGTAATGIIERNTDTDYFSFVSQGLSYTFTIGGLAKVSNLDVLVRVYNANGTLLETYNPTDSYSVEFTFNEKAGQYYLSVEGTGNGSLYSDYASLGGYTIAVNFEQPLIVTTEEDEQTDNGQLSLREAITLAGTTGYSSHIYFDSSLAGKTIVLKSGELAIDREITIDASELEEEGTGLTIDANGLSRVFSISGGTSLSVSLMGLGITGGMSQESGGGILNSVNLTIRNCRLFGNQTAKDGGGIASTGLLQVTNSIVSDNIAAKWGGGLYSEYDIALVNVTVAGNTGLCGGFCLLVGTAIVANSIIAANIQSDATPDDDIDRADLYTFANAISGYYNLSPYSLWSSQSQGNILYQTGSPLFVDIASKNYSLASGCLACNAGSEDWALWAEIDLSGHDILGQSRIFSDFIDLGACEYYIEVSLNSSADSCPLDGNVVLSALSETGSDLTWYWDLSGSEQEEFITSTGSTLSFSPLAEGMKVGDNCVRVKAIDSLGIESEIVTMILFVERVQPTIMLDSKTVCSDTILILSIQADSFTNDYYSQWSVRWGDGITDTFALTSSSLSCSHYYATNDNYCISLELIDQRGDGENDWFDIAEHDVGSYSDTEDTITIEAVSPTANLNASELQVSTNTTASTEIRPVSLLLPWERNGGRTDTLASRMARRKIFNESNELFVFDLFDDSGRLIEEPGQVFETFGQ